ncbi:MAG TPA: serine hydrolase domain-containing protein [Natronosporangium sp.]
MSSAASKTAAQPPTGRRPPGRRLLIGAVALSILVGAAATAVLGPRPPRLGEATTGDRQLAEQVRGLLRDREGTGYRALSVAVVENGQLRVAGLGESGDRDRPTVDERSRFEIGSIGKALTGLLLAEMAEAGEVDLDQRVGDLVPGTPLGSAGDATLAELASHRSGLPRLSPRPMDLLRASATSFTGGDPYHGSPQQVMDIAAGAGPDGDGSYAYSNLGYATLGSALAAHAGIPYRDLLRERVLAPLSMTDTVVVHGTDELPDPRVSGIARSGRGQDPWIAEGYAPLGVGIWSTSTDLGRLAAAILDGTAPGLAAIEPQWPAGGDTRIGLGWLTSEIDGRTVTWHNGGTGGFRSWLGIDRAAGRAVVVLGATTLDVDPIGERLLVGDGS